MTSAQPAGTSAAEMMSGKEVSPYRGAPLVSSEGKTTIGEPVVAKIAGIAAREVSGVHTLGGGTSRMVGVLRERIPGATVNQGQGVSVEVGEKQAAVDIDIVADYGVAITELAVGIRRNVVAAIERMTGLEVIEVNITVHDLHIDGDVGEDTDTPARVQ